MTDVRVVRTSTVETVRVVRTDQVRVVRASTEGQVRVRNSGPPGPTGLAGSSTFQVRAGTILGGQRIVRSDATGAAVYADKDEDESTLRDLWITTGAVDAGDIATVQAFGRIVDSSWSWAPGPIYLGNAGVMTQVPPTTGFSRQVASAEGPHALFFNPQPAIVLA